MHSPRHIILLSITLLLALASCTISDEDPSIIYNLDEEFLIRPVEQLSLSGSKLMLEISSLREDLCDNSEILYQYSQINGVSVIKLNDITKPANCITTDIPPSAIIALKSNGSNSRLINVTIKDIIENKGQIDEYPDRYEIKMNSTLGILINHRELLKIQPMMLWGGVDYNNVDKVSIAESFVAIIKQMAYSSSIERGYYGQFEMMNSGTVEIWNDAKTQELRSTFAIGSGMTLSEIASTVEDYRSQNPGMRFFVYNAFGESL